MTSHIDKLISGYLDGVLSAEQQAELSEWIEAGPANADRFARAVMLDNRLHAEINASPYTKRANLGLPCPAHRVAGRVWPRIAFAAAACLLMGIGISIWIANQDTPRVGPGGGNIAPRSEFASVAHTVDAEWGDDSTLNMGDRLSRQVIDLRAGFVNLAFDDGVEVTLHGPARYELLGPGQTKLTAGLLTATVPPGAEGFTVDTPTAEIVDLGTSFGVDLREEGFASVSVFDGQVEVAVPDATEKHVLTEGQSVRIGADQKVEEVAFDPKRFERVWPIASGIVESTSVFRFVPPWPRDIRFVRSDKDIFVAAEGHAVNLADALRVNISEPGEYVRVDDLTPLELPAGQRVRSYILHYFPAENLPPPRAKRVSGSITFDRPVLGLIVLHDELFASSRRFARRGLGEAHMRRQLDLTGGSNGDRIVLSEDRKTVTLDVISPRRTSDLVRVIIDSRRGFRPARMNNKEQP